MPHSRHRMLRCTCPPRLPQGVAVSGASRRSSPRSSARKRSLSSPSCTASSSRAARSCSRARAARQKRVRRRQAARLPAGDEVDPRGRLEGRAAAEGLLDRRVEITGPTDRKMVINALNSGASTFMADFEDANCPTWDNMIDGQINLRDAVRRTITFEQRTASSYQLNDKTAVLHPAPARLAPGREARARRRQAGVRRHLRLRALLLPQREGAARARLGPVLLPAEDGVPPRGAAVERHLRLRAERAGHPARHASRPRC